MTNDMGRVLIINRNCRMVEYYSKQKRHETYFYECLFIFLFRNISQNLIVLIVRFLLIVRAFVTNFHFAF